MKLVFDLFPVILFFVTYKIGVSFPERSAELAQSGLGWLVADGRVPADQAAILLATAVTLVASFVQVGSLLATKRKVDPALWISLFVVALSGGATIWLHDETFIKWKPTLLYLAFAAILLGGQLFARRNFLRSLLGVQLSLTDAAWLQLLWAWIVFFLAMAALNLFVAYFFSTDTWVTFKLFGALGLTLAFAIFVGIWAARRSKDNDASPAR